MMLQRFFLSNFCYPTGFKGSAGVVFTHGILLGPRSEQVAETIILSELYLNKSKM